MVPTLKVWIFLKLVFVSSQKQFTDQHCSPAEAWPPLCARSSHGGKEDRQVTALSVQPSRAWLTVPITVDLLPQLAHICNMEDISKMEGKTIRNIQSTQQNLLASRHFPPFQCCLFPVQALKHLLSFYANDHWAASSHLTTGNMYCFSRWGLSFLHTPINEQIHMYSFTIIHFLSKLGLCFLHTHTHTHVCMYPSLTHTCMHARTYAHAQPYQSSLQRRWSLEQWWWFPQDRPHTGSGEIQQCSCPPRTAHSYCLLCHSNTPADNPLKSMEICLSLQHVLIGCAM